MRRLRCSGEKLIDVPYRRIHSRCDIYNSARGWLPKLLWLLPVITNSVSMCLLNSRMHCWIYVEFGLCQHECRWWNCKQRHVNQCLPGCLFFVCQLCWYWLGCSKCRRSTVLPDIHNNKWSSPKRHSYWSYTLWLRAQWLRWWVSFSIKKIRTVNQVWKASSALNVWPNSLTSVSMNQLYTKHLSHFESSTSEILANEIIIKLLFAFSTVFRLVFPSFWPKQNLNVSLGFIAN